MMDIEDIKKLIDGNPDILIKKAEELGVNFSNLDEDIAKKIVKEKYSITEDQLKAVDFIFWISYFVERTAEELIVYPEIKIGARKEAIEVLVDKLNFENKIRVIEQLYTGKKEPFIKLMRDIKEMRNNIAHGRFDSLNYDGYHLSDNRARIKLIAGLRDSALRKNQE